MAQIDRFSVSLDTELLAAFDRHIAAKGYGNRSEAIRDLIRDLLLTSRLAQGNELVAAVVTVMCDHRVGETAARLRATLADNANLVYGSLHLPVDRDRDFIIVALQGPSDEIQPLANRIQAMRGLSHGHLAVIPKAASRTTDE